MVRIRKTTFHEGRTRIGSSGDTILNYILYAVVIQSGIKYGPRN